MNFVTIEISLKWYASLSPTIMWKMKKIVRAILQKSKQNNIFKHLSPYNPELRTISEKTLREFWDLMVYYLMQKIKKSLRVVSEKICGLATTY